MPSFDVRPTTLRKRPAKNPVGFGVASRWKLSSLLGGRLLMIKTMKFNEIFLHETNQYNIYWKI
jgi:hypothetical protein